MLKIIIAEPKGRAATGQNIVSFCFWFNKLRLNLAHFRTSYFVFEAAAVLINHFETFPDILEEVGGHDVQEGVLEELHEDEEAGAEEQDTSQPETVAAQGETGVVKDPEKSDFPILT